MRRPLSIHQQRDMAVVGLQRHVHPAAAGRVPMALSSGFAPDGGTAAGRAGAIGLRRHRRDQVYAARWAAGAAVETLTWRASSASGTGWGGAGRYLPHSLSAPGPTAARIKAQRSCHCQAFHGALARPCQALLQTCSCSFRAPPETSAVRERRRPRNAACLRATASQQR